MKNKRLWWGSVMVFSGVLFIGLLNGVIVHAKWIHMLDMWGSKLTCSSRTVLFLYRIVAVFASPEVISLIIMVICWFIGRKTQWKRGIAIGGMFFGGTVIAMLIKEIVRRPRPVLAVDHGFSFPSGHVFVTTLLVLGILIYLGHYGRHLGSERRFGAAVAALCWAIIVALSRVALRAHYLSDVIASGLLGIWWVSLGELLWNISKSILLERMEGKE